MKLIGFTKKGKMVTSEGEKIDDDTIRYIDTVVFERTRDVKISEEEANKVALDAKVTAKEAEITALKAM